MQKLFEVQQVLAGRMTFIIRDDTEEYFFDVSYLTNFPDDFMLALTAAIERWPNDERADSFTTDEEPRFSEWEVTADGDNLIFRVTTYESSSRGKMTGASVITVNRDRFLKDFVSEMSDVLQRFGLFGYRREWNYEFPLSLFLQLKSYVSDREILEIQKEGSDNCGGEYWSTDFNREREELKDI